MQNDNIFSFISCCRAQMNTMENSTMVGTPLGCCCNANIEPLMLLLTLPQNVHESFDLHSHTHTHNETLFAVFYNDTNHFENELLMVFRYIKYHF